ncbi:hypothetical protein WDU94_002169 [Cyamophila willieti]
MTENRNILRRNEIHIKPRVNGEDEIVLPEDPDDDEEEQQNASFYSTSSTQEEPIVEEQNVPVDSSGANSQMTESSQHVDVDSRVEQEEAPRYSRPKRVIRLLARYRDSILY